MNHSDTITGIRARWYTRLMGSVGAGKVYERALTLLNPRPGERILDVGCGTGTFLKLVKRTPLSVPLTLIGIDASEDMLHEARKDSDGISFRYADASELPFADATFDCVVSILALHHMPLEVKEKALGEAVRVLRKGGRIIILDLSRPNKGWWGSVLGIWFDFHSHTRGNWSFIMAGLQKRGFSVEEGTERGAVGYVVAQVR